MASVTIFFVTGNYFTMKVDWKPTGLVFFLSQPNSTTTQFNLTSQMLGLTRKWVFTTTNPPTHHHKLNVSNFSAFPDLIYSNFKGRFLGSTTATTWTWTIATYILYIYVVLTTSEMLNFWGGNWSCSSSSVTKLRSIITILNNPNIYEIQC